MVVVKRKIVYNKTLTIPAFTYHDMFDQQRSCMCNVTTVSHKMQSFFFVKVQVYEREVPTVVSHCLLYETISELYNTEQTTQSLGIYF